MIEIFKTNIAKKRQAKMIMNHLLAVLPDATVNFDLEDCDRILRVESKGQNFDTCKVTALIMKMGFECEVLNY